MLTLAAIEADIKAGLAKIESLIYTPQTAHPVLEDVRQLVVSEIQSHLTAVTGSAVSMGNAILQQVEQALAAHGVAPAPATPPKP